MFTRPHCLGWVLFGLLAVAVTSPAGAQSGDMRQLMNRLDRIERDLTIIQRQIYRGEVPTSAVPTPSTAPGLGGTLPPAFAAQLEVRLSELEGTLQDLTGRVEEITFGLTRLGERMEKLAGDVEFRLQQLERGGPAAVAAQGAVPGESTVAGVAQAPGPVATTDAAAPAVGPEAAAPGTAAALATPVLPEGTPEEQYKYAFGLLKQGDWEEAEAALHAFLKTHPDHPRAANAQYWLGETYYARKDYARAAVAFAEGYRKFPRGAKAQDNLLKLALSLSGLNKRQDACASLAQLGAQFPEASLMIKRRAAAESQRLGCE